MSGLEEELYVAVNENNIDLVKVLLRKGANVNTLVHSGCTVLSRAVQLGLVEIIQVLLNAEDYLPPEESASSSDCKASAQDAEYTLDPDLMSWSQEFNKNYQVEDLAVPSKTDCKSSRNDSWYEHPQTSNCGLGLFQSLCRFTSRRRKCDVNLPDFYDRMPIHYAAEAGRGEVLDLLLKAGCRVSVSDSENITPLHLSVSRGHEHVTEMLLKAGSRVNSKTSDKSSALHIAASRGYSNIVETLLWYGAKIDIFDASDRTPLLLAVSRANINVVHVLLKHGAKVNVEEIHGYTPLAEAVWQKDKELVKILIKSGAKVTGGHHLLHYCVMHRSLDMTQLLLHGGAFVNVRDDSGDTPMHIAVRGAQLDVLRELLHHGGNVNLRNSLSGQTLIHEAVDGVQEQDLKTFCAILHILLHRGSQLNVETLIPGDTPLYRAIVTDKFLFAEELIKSGSNVNLGNVYSCNIDNLCLARRKNHFRTVKLLVYAGFHLWRTPWLEILPSSFPHSYSIHSIKGWLIYMKRNPMNLVDLCRVIIRQNLGENIVYKVQKLHIPLQLKHFLLLEDVNEGAEEESTRDNNNTSFALR